MSSNSKKIMVSSDENITISKSHLQKESLLYSQIVFEYVIVTLIIMTFIFSIASCPKTP